MTRITIKKHHDAYINNIAAQMGTDFATALDYMLWQLKQQGFSFTHPLPLPAQPVQPVQAVAPIPGFIPFVEIATPVETTIDPVISRFIELGLCNEQF